MSLPTPTTDFIECIESTLTLGSRPKLIANSQNYVFEAELNDSKIALRVTPEYHRGYEQIQSEIDVITEFLNFIDLPHQPLPLKLNHHIVPINFKHDTYFAVAFEYMNGSSLDPGNMTDIKSAAAILARLHRATSAIFKSIDRPSFIHSAIYDIFYSTHDYYYEKLETWKSRLQSSPKFYGIIHGDFNFSNLIKTKNYIYLIDFEDAHYSWYAYDIANALYMELFEHRSDPSFDNFSVFYQQFLQSYLLAWPEAHVILNDVPMFITYRVLMLDSWLNGNPEAPYFIKAAESKWKKELIQFIDLYKTKLYPLIENMASSDALEKTR